DGVDVVMPASSVAVGMEGVDLEELLPKLESMLPSGHRQFVENLLAKYQVPPLPNGEEGAQELLGWTDTTARPQVDIALSHPIKLLANALGPPPKDITDLAHEHGVKVAALVGRSDQAA